MARVLVVGGSGFLGSHTADELSRCGHEVTILDRERSKWLKPDQNMIVGDVLDGEVLLQAMEGVDSVYYFAGIADLEASTNCPMLTINTNVMGVSAALDAAVRSCVSKFIYASTMYVYSTQGSFYRASKQAAELLVKVFAQESDLDYVIVRYGSLYGPRAQEWNGIVKLVRQIIENGEVAYQGNADDVREYIHVLDAAKLSVEMLKDNFSNRSVILTGHQATTVEEVLQMLLEITGKPFSVTYLNEGSFINRYGKTPYRYAPDETTKLISNEFIDLGHGLLNVIEEVSQDDREL